jgi:enamine deaminase RidA (YjgF/YER057c/UK114 family)
MDTSVATALPLLTKSNLTKSEAESVQAAYKLTSSLKSQSGEVGKAAGIHFKAIAQHVKARVESIETKLQALPGEVESHSACAELLAEMEAVASQIPWYRTSIQTTMEHILDEYHAKFNRELAAVKGLGTVVKAMGARAGSLMELRFFLAFNTAVFNEKVASQDMKYTLDKMVCGSIGADKQPADAWIEETWRPRSQCSKRSTGGWCCSTSDSRTYSPSSSA